MLLLSGCTLATAHETRDIVWTCTAKAKVVNDDYLPVQYRYLLTYIECE